jgi:ribosomal protein RSM22 (predicted rRNA methylase)
MALKFDTKSYRKWVTESDFFYNRFELLAGMLENFFEMKLRDLDFSNAVASNLWTAYNLCDEIDYEQDDLAIAYSIIHFLDRYHRFQKSYMKLLDHKFLPIARKPIEILDVGTGSGSALFAISDTYNSIKEFGKETGNISLSNIEFKNDYVERSSGFRNWLHHFTEYVNYPKLDIPWQVPFHHGTFHNFEDINFNLKSDYGDRTYIDKKRYNIVVFSNFLTKAEHIVLWENQIRNCFRFLRNKGKLVVVGGIGPKYQEIYTTLDKTLLNFNFSNKLYIGKCNKLLVNQDHLQFDLSDRYGKRLKEYFKAINEIFRANDSIRFMSSEVVKHFSNYSGTRTGRPKKWGMQIYDKYSRYKWYKFRNKKVVS